MKKIKNEKGLIRELLLQAREQGYNGEITYDTLYNDFINISNYSYITIYDDNDEEVHLCQGTSSLKSVKFKFYEIYKFADDDNNDYSGCYDIEYGVD